MILKKLSKEKMPAERQRIHETKQTVRFLSFCSSSLHLFRVRLNQTNLITFAVKLCYRLGKLQTGQPNLRPQGHYAGGYIQTHEGHDDDLEQST